MNSCYLSAAYWTKKILKPVQNSGIEGGSDANTRSLYWHHELTAGVRFYKKDGE